MLELRCCLDDDLQIFQKNNCFEQQDDPHYSEVNKYSS
jgi:hypothetical protein